MVNHAHLIKTIKIWLCPTLSGLLMCSIMMTGVNVLSLHWASKRAQNKTNASVAGGCSVNVGMPVTCCHVSEEIHQAFCCA